MTCEFQVSVDSYVEFTAVTVPREKMMVGLQLNLGWHEVELEMVDGRGRALGMGAKVMYLGV